MRLKQMLNFNDSIIFGKDDVLGKTVHSEKYPKVKVNITLKVHFLVEFLRIFNVYDKKHYKKLSWLIILVNRYRAITIQRQISKTSSQRKQNKVANHFS